MRISTYRSRIKGAGAAAALFAGLLSVVGACTPRVAMAPFPERPDTVSPGSLLGPFNGQVLDQASTNPIPATLIVGVWAYERRGALPGPAGSQTVTVLTRSDGSYELPRATPPSQGDAVLSRFTLIAYKAGYVGYRSDLRMDDRSPRHDFAQRNHRIRLERFTDGESHARHLVFLGGEERLRRAAQAEIVQAAQELSEAQPAQKEPAAQKKPEPPALPEAGALLLQADVEELGGGKLSFASEPLADNLSAERRGAGYDGIHFRAAGKGEAFDAAVRLWRPGEGSAAEAEALYVKLKEALGVTEEQNELGDRSLRAFDDKRRIHGVAALLRERGLVVQLACGGGLCPKAEVAARLLGKLLGRLPAK